MADIISIQNSTLVTGTTAFDGFLIAELNNKLAGMHLFEFTETVPDMDLLQLRPYTDFIVDNSVIFNTATSYGVGLAVTVNNSSLAIPLFKVDQIQNVNTNLRIIKPTLVENLVTTGQFLTVKLNGEFYGVPLYEYGSIYLDSTPASAYTPTTTIIANLVTDVDNDAGSTALNSKIKSYSRLIERVKRSLGWPTININMCDANIVEFIDQSMEYFTKYGGYTEEYLLFNTSIYKKGIGIKVDDLFSSTPEMRTTGMAFGSAAYDYDLQDYRKVIDCFAFEQGDSVGINTLFTLEQALVQQTYYGYMLGSTGFDLVSWEIVKGWLDTRKKVLAQEPRYRFNPKTQIFQILPEPYANQNYYGVIGCYVERPIKDLISEPWVIEYTLALASIALGRIYGKYQNMALPIGGGSINYSDILSYGLKRKEELEKELYTGYGFVEAAPPTFFLG